MFTVVFETIVVYVLNWFLGSYVENLNRTQLKLGIWGGDVVLDNLLLKQNALEELNIPVQIVYGHLGKLVLKIPWKNLYGASVEATIDRLFLIVKPAAEVKYDYEKEEKMALAAKQAELARVEAAKKMEIDKDKLDETFVEQLVSQIIKNVQLKITDIHLRYEDTITNPEAPFSLGITLHNLSVHTTDDNWKQTVIQEAVTKIFKILNLEGLAIYWNPSTELYSKWGAMEIQRKLSKEIATRSSQSKSYKYVLGPINTTAKLKLNRKPEGDIPKFSIPKVIFNLHMEQLSVNLTKSQYRDMMLLADSMDRLNKGAPYRKFRPDLKLYKGHYKEWWKFAYTCILEDQVRKRHRNWNWSHMLNHRKLCKNYAAAYRYKLSNSKVNAEQQCIINEAEKKLDLFNLVVIRQWKEIEVERRGKLEEEAMKSRGWFSGWFSGGSNDEELTDGTAIVEQFKKAMTPEETEKLFRAIDYQENTAPLHLPVEYVAIVGNFRLDRLQVAVNDDVEVVKACVDNVVVDLLQRPSANALRLDVQMHALSVTGVQQRDRTPQLVTSAELTQDVNLLNVVFETNPLDGKCDQRVKVSTRPLQIVYDAQTVIEIVEVFKPPAESTALTTLQAAAGNKLSDLKERSVLALQYAVQHHTFIDIDVDIAASHVIVPQTGLYKGGESCVVLKLGAISVKSESSGLDVNRLYCSGLADDVIIRDIALHGYDKMALQLTEIQVVIALAGDDWRSAISSNSATPLHLLQPADLTVQIHQCLVSDPRMPKIKVTGELDKIAINISEDRFLTLCEIIVGMPLPKSQETTQLKPGDSKGSSLSSLKYLDPMESQKHDKVRTVRRSDEQTVQLTEVEAFFIMKELIVSVNRPTVDILEGYDKLLVFSLTLLELTATKKTFTLETKLRLGAVQFQHHRHGHEVINILKTPLNAVASSQYLFTLSYCNVNKKCREFRSFYASVEQLIELDLANLKLLLHLQSFQEILLIINEYQTRLQIIQSSVDRTANAGPLDAVMDDEKFTSTKSKVSVAKLSHRKQIESIQLKVNAKLGDIEIEFATDRRPLAAIFLHGGTAGLVLKSSYTQVDCAIESIKLNDLNPDTIYKEIIKVLGGDVMNVQVVMYNLEPHPDVSDVTMSVEAQVSCLRIVFLHRFVNSMLEFMSNFQTAQQAIIAASSQAADAARSNIQTVYQNSTKLLLKLRLAAPIIVIPENSRSLDAMLIDLGRTTLNNKFVDLAPVNTEVSNNVTIDELTLDIEDMKVSCVRLVDVGTIGQERELLKPTSFELLVKRSLSSWYEALPDLDVSGRMKTIAVTVRHSDYKSIMKILNQNLQESQKEVEESTALPVLKIPSRAPVNSQTSKMAAKSNVAVVTVNKEVKKPRMTIKFAFTMDSFVIDLLNTVNSNEQSLFVKDVELARFCLALLSIKGRVFSDHSLHTSVRLADCTLDDTRPGRGARITRYLERRREKKELGEDDSAQAHDKTRSMIDITYTLKGSHTFIDMRIFSFNLILAMDFMNKIAEFVFTCLAEDVPNHKTKEDSRPVKSLQEKSMASVNIAGSSMSAPALPEQASCSMMSVDIEIEKPDIILVESLEQKQCDALVLNMEALFKLRKTAARMLADGGISGLQMVVRRLGANRSNTQPRYVLSPTTLSLVLTQPDSGMHIDIDVSDVKITVSPDVIFLLNRVIATITSGEQHDKEDANKTIFYSKLWDMQPFTTNDHWFLKAGEVRDAPTHLEEDVVETPAPSGEICLLSCPSIVLSFEMEIGAETIPVLSMQASLSGLTYWTSNLNLELTWAMLVSYYNMERAEWEPLVEPSEGMQGSQYTHVPWELKMKMVMRTQESQLAIDSTDEAVNIWNKAQRLPNNTVTISSKEPLEITLTKTGMEVLTQLGNSLSAAVTDLDNRQASTTKNSDDTVNYLGAPYVLHNCTGLPVKIMLGKNHDFSVFLTEEDVSTDDREVVLEPNVCLPLQLKHGALCGPAPSLTLNVLIMKLEDEVEIPVKRADKRYFSIGHKLTTAATDGNEPRVASIGLISDIVIQDAALHIYLRSVVQVSNNLAANVSVSYMSGDAVRVSGDVKPGGLLRLPLQAVHTRTGEIFFSVEGFTMSATPFVWRELQYKVNISHLLQCDSKVKLSGEKFYFRAVGKMVQVFHEHSNRHTPESFCYDIVLRPTVKLQNCLPVDIVVSQLEPKWTQVFKPGEMFHLTHLAPNWASVVIMIPNYLDKCWVCTKNLPDAETQLSVWSFESHDSPAMMTLDVGMHSVETEGMLVLSLYCPFWMLNKTGFTLCYRNADETGNVIFHPKDYTEPILFTFRAENFFGKKKASIRVESGEWSEQFSLDVAGSAGLVVCRNEDRTYQLAVNNQLTFNSLTKMVTFTPFFLIINEAPFDIQYLHLQRRSGDPWITVPQNSRAPLGPVIEKEDRLLVMRVACSTTHSAPFLYTEQRSVCLKLDNEYGGLHVETQLSEGGTYVTVRQYRPGHAPALLVNYSPHALTIYEKMNVNIKKLPSMQKMLYTWENPAAGPRVLIVEAHGNKEVEYELRKDGIGEFLINEHTKVWRVSFLDGLQRVVLFTDNELLAHSVHTVGEAEVVDTEIVLSIDGIGLSLVNDDTLHEVVYISISGSGIIWEQVKPSVKHFKRAEVSTLVRLEDAYQQYLTERTGDMSPIARVNIDDEMEVDFEEMRMIKPNACFLLRTLQPGLWASYGMTAHSRRLHARLHRLQIDQQLPLPTFPVVLAPVPPPRTVASTVPCGMKPFIEVSIVELHSSEHSKVRQYKYFKVLIQEFQVNIDMGLVIALMGIFPQKLLTEDETLEAFKADYEKAGQPLEALAAISVASDQKNFYDNLHLSPLKVHVSFSQGGTSQVPTSVGAVLQALGVTFLADMNDVVFKLSYYERKNEFLSQNELVSQVWNHYTGQAREQLYVLLLGLDVIGNPYGLVVGLKRGLEDLFYEPFQGAILGPDEFAEGLLIGVRSLVGHALGGAAGAAGRISGAVGHGLAALSLDKEDQKTRRYNITKPPPANLQEGLARSGRRLVMGVVDGVTGMITKPLEGMQDDGIHGYYKGLLKGAVGFWARPIAGAVDFATGSLDAVKRAADLSKEVTKRRAPRYLPPDRGVQPYSRLHAEGYKMLSELEKGKFVATDTYEAHVWLVPAKEAVLCTDKRLMHLKNNVFGGWQIVWEFLWIEIPDIPTAANRGVYVPTAKKKVLGMFPSAGSGKVIPLYDEQQKRYLLAQCERLMRKANTR